MEQFTKVIIYDTEGNIIFNESVNSPIIGLQTGETFWYGTQTDRKWSKVIKITYGLDTLNKTLVVELIVEATQASATKTMNTPLRKSELVNHGEKAFEDVKGGTWSINDGDILVSGGIGGYTSDKGYVCKFTLQVQSPSGPKIKSIDKACGGTFIEVETEERKVVATISHIDAHEITFFATESKYL